MARTATVGGDYASRTDICGVTGYPLTFAAWINPANVTAIHPIVTMSQAGGTDDSLILWVRGDAAGDHLAIRAAQGGAATFEATNSSGSVVAGSWQHACGVFESDTVRHIHLNGVCTTNAGTSVVFPTGMNRTALGAAIRASTIVASCDIAFAAVWNVALTEAEIQRLAAGRNPLEIRNSSIVASWNCKAVSVPEVDQKTGAYPLAVTGTFATAASDPTIVYGGATYYAIGGDFGGLGMSANGPAFARANGTVSSTALALTDSPFSFTAAQLGNANRAVVTANSNPVVIMYTGDAPTATSGIYIPAYMSYPVDGTHNVGKLKIIRAGSDSTVTVTLHA